jgi:hypothetical protein
MQGEPKWFGTRADVMNWQAICEAEGTPERFKASLQKLYDGRLIWGNDAALADGVSGVEDATHRVLENRDMETGVVSHIQQELVVDPNAYIFTRLGFTDGEVLAMLG